MAEFEENGRAWRRHLAAVLGKCFSAVLIAAIIGVVAISFQFGIDRGQESQLSQRRFGQFLPAVCAVLTHDKYHAGRYVCDESAEQQMRAPDSDMMMRPSPD
jgi:hypothetical protein